MTIFEASKLLSERYKACAWCHGVGVGKDERGQIAIVVKVMRKKGESIEQYLTFMHFPVVYQELSSPAKARKN